MHMVRLCLWAYVQQAMASSTSPPPLDTRTCALSNTLLPWCAYTEGMGGTRQ